MVAIDFPATPSVGQEFTAAGILYVWNGYGWLVVPADLTTGGAFVHKSGDIMTGNLTIDKPNPAFILDKNIAAEINQIIGSLNGSTRWRAAFGNEDAEAGGNAGSNFIIRRYNDAGVSLGDVFIINRATGLITVAGNPTAPLGVVTKQMLDAMPPPLVIATLDEARAGVDNTKAMSPYDHNYSHTPAFWAGMGQMLIGTNAWTAINSWSESLDTDNVFNGVSWRPTVPGWYTVGGKLSVPTLGNNYIGIGIGMNGVLTNNIAETQNPGTSTISLSLSTMMHFNGTTDYVEFWALSDFAPGPKVTNGIFFGHRLFA